MGITSQLTLQERRIDVKPFLKWAGGKTQLLGQFKSYFPRDLIEGRIKYYFEPFVGSGAVYFHIKKMYNIEKAYLYDINEELILTYKVIQKDVFNLIKILGKHQREYYSLNDDDRKEYYYHVRDSFNSKKSRVKFNVYSKNWNTRAAQIIFMNKTCFNGLFRQNRIGEFNVPFGRYKNPKILDRENLINVSEALKGVILSAKDFTAIKGKVDEDSFVYFDPPYRPISNTSGFTSYSSNGFAEKEQIRLANLFRELNQTKAKLMLSNSDPKNENPKDNFFERMYKGFKINRVYANRIINCNASKRGQIKELVITNY